MGALVSRKEKTENEAIPDAVPTEQPKKGRLTAFRASLNRARQLTEDWVYLLLLGSIMATLTLIMDFITDNTNKFHQWAYDQADQIEIGIWRIMATYGVWTSFFVLMIGIAALLTRLISPQAIGSGIPEIKTIFRGVILKEYLTMRTMLAKFIGLTLTLGAGLPLGKEGPLVHMSSVVASQLSRLVHSFQGIYENESRSSEMLAAGCAVGVACTFSAPIGGVLFSIEVTSVFFAVRNYWRGFFAAACAATISRVITTLLKDPELDMNAQFQTRFPTGKAYTLQEMPIFALIGFVMGIMGAIYIVVHRNIVLFLRRNHYAKMVFQRYWMIYPILIPFLFGTITYPEALGQFMTGRKKFTQTVPDLFNNCIWSNTTFGEVCSESVTNSWTGLNHDNSIFISLVVFQIFYFFLTILCSTVPIPAGMFISVFVIGAAFGRTIGEIVAICLDGNIYSGGKMQSLYPGAYAVIGAAALSGAVTHTVSVAVIVFEVTGQMLLLLPVMISVIIAVAVCSYLQPSLYDSVIRIKHLPYLPDIRHTPSIFHTITVDRIMVTPVKCIPRDCSYRHVRFALEAMPKLRAFPVVDSTTSMTLLGSVNRYTLLMMLDDQVTEAKRREEARRRVRQAIVRAHSSTIRSIGKEGEDEKDEKGNPELFRRRKRFTIVPVSREGSVDHGVDEHQMEKVKEQKRRQHVAEQITQMLQVQVGRPKAGSTTSSRSVSGITSNHATVHSTIGGFFRSLTRARSTSRRKESEEPVHFDLVGEERDAWEDAILDESIDFSSVLVDSTPFQIVSHSSLFKVHSLFSLLGLNRAYVTEQGKLVGVVALKEIREAIEKGQSGQLLPTTTNEREGDEEEGGDAKGEESHDVYDDDSSDYEDNLQGKLEVVPRLEEATTLVASDHLQLQMMRQTMSSRENSLTNLSRMGSERARWRMDEMTTRRRRKGILPKRNVLKRRDTERETTTTDDEGEVDQGKEEIRQDPPRIEVKRPSEDADLTWKSVTLEIDEDDDEDREMDVERFERSPRTERRLRRHVQFHMGDENCDCDEQDKASG